MRDWFFISNPLPGVCPHKNTQNFLPQPVANIKRKWKQIMSILEKSFSLLLLLLGLWISINVKCIPKSRSQFFKSCLSELPWWLRWQRIGLKHRRLGFRAWEGKIPWRRKWLPTPVFLPGEFHGQRSLVDYIQPTGSPSVRLNWATNVSLHQGFEAVANMTVHACVLPFP